MTTQEVANRFNELAQQGNWADIQSELYAENCVSIEPDFAPAPRVEGMDAIRSKAEQWQNMIEETHGGYSDEPIVNGNHFCCRMGMDVTMKGQGRVQMDELAMYEVQNGKIVKEQFFYGQ